MNRYLSAAGIVFTAMLIGATGCKQDDVGDIAVFGPLYWGEAVYRGEGIYITIHGPDPAGRTAKVSGDGDAIHERFSIFNATPHTIVVPASPDGDDDANIRWEIIPETVEGKETMAISTTYERGHFLGRYASGNGVERAIILSPNTDLKDGQRLPLHRAALFQTPEIGLLHDSHVESYLHKWTYRFSYYIVGQASESRTFKLTRRYLVDKE